MANPENPETKQGYEPKEPPKGEKPEKPADSNDPKKKCPELKDPEKEPPLADPKPYTPANCCCPTTPSDEGSCFDKLIEQQDNILKEAERAKTFKTELEDLMGKAKKADGAYTQEKYDDFKRRWGDQDKKIVTAIGTVTCRVKCWRCFLECEVCTLLHKITDTEEYIEGGALIPTIGSLRDQKYWRERNRDKKLKQFNRIKALLTAWSSPAETIEAALNANNKLIGDLDGMTDADAAFSLFMKLIPLHLAIKPRDATTSIEPQYQYICGKPDDHELCCGVDTETLTATQLYVAGEPQAYIIDPKDYLPLICCLASNRYLPAKDQLAKAEAALAEVEAAIGRLTADLDRRKKSVFEDFRARVSVPVKCDDYKEKTGKGGDSGDGGGGKKPGYGKPDQGPEQYSEDTPEQTAS